MAIKNNLIDLNERRKKKSSGSVSKGAKSNDKASILDMTELRQEILNQERREVKRTILTGFIGAFAIIPQKGLLKVAVYDISENGVSFDIEGDGGHLKGGEEVAMRIYLNQQTYFPFVVQINNVRKISEEGVTRHGSGFVKGTLNEEALFHFIKFIENVSASLQRDQGDVMVSNLKK